MYNFNTTNKDLGSLYKSADLDKEGWQVILQWKKEDFQDIDRIFVFSYSMRYNHRRAINLEENRNAQNLCPLITSVTPEGDEDFIDKILSPHVIHTYNFVGFSAAAVSVFLFLPRQMLSHSSEVICISKTDEVLCRYFLLIEGSDGVHQANISQIRYRVVNSLLTRGENLAFVDLEEYADEQAIEHGPRTVNVIDQSVAGAITGEGKRRMKVDR